MAEPKILTLDIETSPHMTYTWGLFDQNIGLPQLVEATRVICFAAKWHHESKVQFFSEFHQDHRTMVERAFDLLNEADIVVHFNGKSFDIPHLNREFDYYRMGRPAPYKQVDLLSVAKKHFRFASNKLAYITEYLGLSGKMANSGFELWLRCLKGDPEAWAEMMAYNVQDVVTEEELYDRWLPWIDAHPNVALFVDTTDPVCRTCQSRRMQRRGTSITSAGMFQRFQCQDCGSWSKGKTRINSTSLRGDS